MKSRTWVQLLGIAFWRHGILRSLPFILRCAALMGLSSLGTVYGDTLLSTTTYSYSGSTSTYTVPANTNYLIVKAWGAGGGCWVGYLYGGAGGFAQGQVATTPGTAYTIYVGGGGLDNSNGGGGGWPWGSAGSGGGCGGGGASAFEGGSVNVIAGGGGGASNAPGGVGNGGTYGTPGGLSTGTTHGGGGGGTSSSAGGAGGQNYFTGATNTVSMGQTGFAATAVNTSDPDYPGGYLGYGGGTYIYNGNNGYVVVKAYQTTVAPTFSGSLTTQNVNQNQTISYTIPASGAPAPTFSASGLPPGLSCNSTTGVISGNVGIGSSGPSPYTFNSTVTATNSLGNCSGTLTWVVTAASIIPNGTVNGPNPLLTGDTLNLVQAGSTNFGLGWTQSTVWNPDSTVTYLPNLTSYQTQAYVLSHGAGTYTWQFQIFDTYGNYVVQWINVGVSTTADTPPTSITSTTTGSTFVALSWSGASATAGISYYIVYRNGVSVGTSSSTTYTDSTVSPSTAYTYSVATVDIHGLTSGTSWPYSVTTAADFELFTPVP